MFEVNCSVVTSEVDGKVECCVVETLEIENQGVFYAGEGSTLLDVIAAVPWHIGVDGQGLGSLSLINLIIDQLYKKLQKQKMKNILILQDSNLNVKE